MTQPIHILNGPNLNLLGTREPEIYGALTLGEIEQACSAHAHNLGFDIVFRQSNHEGELVDWIQESRHEAAALILNGGAYTHTSIAIDDALKALTIPVVEVHLSNPGNRESFRRRSFVGPAASGLVAGFGAFGYRLAVDAAIELAKKRS